MDIPSSTRSFRQLAAQAGSSPVYDDLPGDIALREVIDEEETSALLDSSRAGPMDIDPDESFGNMPATQVEVPAAESLEAETDASSATGSDPAAPAQEDIVQAVMASPEARTALGAASAPATPTKTAVETMDVDTPSGKANEQPIASPAAVPASQPVSVARRRARTVKGSFSNTLTELEVHDGSALSASQPEPVSVEATEDPSPPVASPSSPPPSQPAPVKRRGRPPKNPAPTVSAPEPEPRMTRRRTRAASKEPEFIVASQPARRSTRAVSREPEAPSSQPAPRRSTRASSREPSAPPPSQRVTRSSARETVPTQLPRKGRTTKAPDSKPIPEEVAEDNDATPRVMPAALPEVSVG